MLRRLPWVLTLLAAACQVSFQAGGAPNRPTPSKTSGASTASATTARPALDRALAAVRSESLSADVHFLASDELEGRDTPSRGLRIAAEYLRARARQLGWQPGAGESWFHTYELVRKTLWPVRTFAAAQKEDMRIAFQEGSDYVFRPRPFVDHELTGDVVFVGSGAPDQLAGLELEGRWALCEDDAAVSWRARRSAAREAGAVGVLVVPPLAAGAEGEPGNEEEESFAERFATWTHAREGLVLPGEAEPGFPHLFLERHAAARLFEFAGVLEPAALEPGRELGVSFTDTRTFDGSGVVEVPNVCALWPGSDPDLADEIIVVSAHFDHVGVDEAGDVYNGADDNASGSAALLAIAEGIRAAGGLRRSLLLIWVSGEEKGLLGSAAWTRDPVLPPGSRVVANLNVDMVGRNAPDQVLMTPSSRHPEHNRLSRLIEANAPLEGFDDLGSADDYWYRSDHANFSRHLAVPVAFLFTDVHEDYHRPGDTPDKLDYDKAARVSRLALRVLFDLDAHE